MKKMSPRFYLLPYIFLALPTVAHADISSSVFGTGTLTLVKEALAYLAVICPIACSVAAVYFFIRKGMADEMDGKMWQKRIVIAICCGVFGGLASAMISMIAGYYGSGVSV